MGFLPLLYLRSNDSQPKKQALALSHAPALARASSRTRQLSHAPARQLSHAACPDEPPGLRTIRYRVSHRSGRWLGRVSSITPGRNKNREYQIFVFGRSLSLRRAGLRTKPRCHFFWPARTPASPRQKAGVTPWVMDESLSRFTFLLSSNHAEYLSMEEPR